MPIRPIRSATACAVAAAVLCGMPAGAQGTTWNERWVGSEWELYTRALAVRGLTDPGMWSIRPMSPLVTDRMSDSIVSSHPWSVRLPRTEAQPMMAVLRPSLTASHNSGFAWGMNDGTVWQGRGTTVWGTAGAQVRWRFLTARIEPMFSRTANAAFELLPSTDTTGFGAVLTGIDLPQRFGDQAEARIHPGQSFVRIDAGPLAAGFSSENIAWGPGIRHNLLLGPNAPGFPHFFMGTGRPVRTPVGAFGLQLLYASLEQSDWSPATMHPRRFGAGLIGVWMPFPQMELGISRFYHKPWPDGFSLRDLGAPFGSVFYDAEWEGTGGADNQLATAFGTVRIRSLGLEVFGEFGRNDRSQGVRDLIVEPEHNAAWTLGFLHATTPDSAAGTMWTTRLEVANARISRIQTLGRGQAPFYTHGSVAQGHTVEGQLLGTPLAEQSGGLELSVDRWARWGRAGMTLLERQLPGDRLVGMPADSGRTQWDLGASMTWFAGGTDLHAQLGHVWDLNRFPGRDAGNLYLRAGARFGLPASLGF